MKYNISQMPKGIYYEDADNKLIRCEFFTDREAERVGKSAALLEDFFENLYRFDGVKESFREFQNDLSKLVSDNAHEISRVDRRYRSFLMEARLFLDHWKFFIDSGNYVGHRDKAAQYVSDFQSLFKKATEEEFDNNPNYVVCYVLRNYVTHAEDAVNHASINGTGNSVYVLRDNVMSINLSKAQRAVMKKQPKEINLQVVGESFLNSLCNIQEKLINYMIDEEVTKALTKLLNVHKTITDHEIKGNNWMVITEVKVQPYNPVDMRHATYAESSHFIEGLNMSYRKLDWHGYEALSMYVRNMPLQV